MIRQRIPLIDRLMRRVREDENGCWIFTGAINDTGYGAIGKGGGKASGNISTHRAAYEYFIADIPTGLDLDHLCRVRACCNPWHLEPVSRKVNAARGLRGPGYGPHERTHCKQGHEYTPSNTYFKTKQRVCKTCHRATIQRKKESA